MSNTPSIFDEMGHGGKVRPCYQTVAEWLGKTSVSQLHLKRSEAEALFRRIGITFAVYGEGGDPERLIPFDLIPRVFSALEWQTIEKGVLQRTLALNAFIGDMYGAQEAISAGVVPEEIVLKNTAYLPQMEGFTPPGGVYAHIVGTDLVRTEEDGFFVLEDNCRTPSGVSYMLENRQIMQRLCPELFGKGKVRPVSDYPDLLRQTLAEVAPVKCDGPPTIAVLTPGHFNSAYYEHSFISDEMGVPLLVGSDLFVDEGLVYMRTTMGPQRVDVIYRRIDDDFLDPQTFRPDSALGVPGLFEAYKSGGVTLVNAPGTGIADDKAIYHFVPDLIRFYLGEEAILPNVPTWRCAVPEERAEALSRMEDLVFKEVHGSGGYGMLIGPKSTKDEIAAYRKRIEDNPAEFIAQPTLALSTSPTLVEEGVAPRHIDFRPFSLMGAKPRLVPGGLTRVALREGSLVVNSSQGGGVKDTWVLK